MTLPDAPAFLIQQTFQGRSDLPPIGTARQEAGGSGPGLFLDFGAVHLRGIREDAKDHSPLAPLLAGGAKNDEKKRQHDLAPWAKRKAPGSKSEWEKTVRECLAEQRSKLNPDALTVPGADLSLAAYPMIFERQIEAIRHAWNGRPDNDPDWFAHFCLHDDWLKEAGPRRLVLNLITDLPDPIGIAFQVRFSRRDRSADEAVLGGLKEIVSVLADDGRRVLVVKSGSLGWLSIAWGAWGFTAGRSQGTWVDSREEIRRRKGQPSPPRLERYFEPQLLHHVLYDDHRRFQAVTGHQQCGCPFCKKLKVAWSTRPAAQHDLYALSDLTLRVAATDRSGRREAVRKIVEDAQTTWASWKSVAGLSPRAEPVHLPVWGSLI
jgi:hypothetical protein